MIIEGNPKEIEAMKEFHKGNRQEGLEVTIIFDRIKQSVSFKIIKKAERKR